MTTAKSGRQLPLSAASTTGYKRFGKYVLIAADKCPPALRQAGDQAPSPAISALAYVPARAASQASALSDRHTRIKHRGQRAKASSQSPQLNITRHCRKPLIGNYQASLGVAYPYGSVSCFSAASRCPRG